MEQWSVLHNVTNDVHYNGNQIDYYKLEVKALGPKTHIRIYGKLEEGGRKIAYLDFSDKPGKLKGEYLGVYEGVKLEIHI